MNEFNLLKVYQDYCEQCKDRREEPASFEDWYEKILEFLK